MGDVGHALVPFREAVSSAAGEIDLASRLGETETGYSCGTAPDSHRLRLSPCRGFGLSDRIRCSKSDGGNQGGVVSQVIHSSRFLKGFKGLWMVEVSLPPRKARVPRQPG
jgi:hypothetical protein